MSDNSYDVIPTATPKFININVVESFSEPDSNSDSKSNSNSNFKSNSNVDTFSKSDSDSDFKSNSNVCSFKSNSNVSDIPEAPQKMQHKKLSAADSRRLTYMNKYTVIAFTSRQLIGRNAAIKKRQERQYNNQVIAQESRTVNYGACGSCGRAVFDHPSMHSTELIGFSYYAINENCPFKYVKP